MEWWKYKTQKQGTKRECQRRKQKTRKGINKSEPPRRVPNYERIFFGKQTPIHNATKRRGIGRVRLWRWQTCRRDILATTAACLNTHTRVRYRCVTSVLCLYWLFRAVIDRLPFCNTRPLRCRFSIFIKIFFWFFYFSFFRPAILHKFADIAHLFSPQSLKILFVYN